MARYAVPGDLLPVLPQYLRAQILDDDHDGSEDPGLAEAILESACDYLDGYLRAAGYVVPLTAPIPPTVMELTLRIGRYYAHERLNLVDDRIRAQWEWVREDLQRVASGELALGLTPSPTVAVGGAPLFTSALRVWGRAETEGW